MRLNKWAVGSMAVLALGCAALKPSSDTDVLAKAQLIGEQSGQLTCLAIVVKHPASKPDVLKVSAKVADVLASADPTTTAVAEAVNLLPKDEDRLIAGAAVNVLITVLTASGHPAPSLAKDSPAFVGLAAFAAACQKALI